MTPLYAVISNSLIALIVSTLLGCGSSNPKTCSKDKEVKIQKKKRSPEQALATAKQCMDDLLKDASKAEKWLSDSLKAYESPKDDKNTNQQPDDYIRAARQATVCAYNAIKASENSLQNLPEIIEQVTTCALQCRKAVAAYSSIGILLSSLEQEYKNLEELKSRAALATGSFFNSFEDKNCAILTFAENSNAAKTVLSLTCSIVSSPIQVMKGDYSTDGEPAVMAIAKEAWQIWTSNVCKETPIGSNNVSIQYQFDFAEQQDQQKFADSLVRVSILLVEGLKACYEAQHAGSAKRESNNTTGQKDLVSSHIDVAG